MIGRILDDIHRRTEGGDAVFTVDDSVTVSRDPDGGIAALATTDEQLQVRVIDRGRIGWAGGLASRETDLVDAALRFASTTDPQKIFLPLPAPLAPVVTAASQAASLGAHELGAYVREVAAALAGLGRPIEVSATRSSGAVEVGNTRGVLARYPTSLIALEVQVAGPEGVGAPLVASLAQCGPPDAADLARLTAEVTSLVGTRPIEREVAPDLVPALFEPRAVRSLLRSLLAWLLEPPSPPTDLRLDERLTLIDDPLADGRPGSRPIDDDGVPSQPTVLVSAGRVVSTPLDLVRGAERGHPATGHAWRRGFSPPRIGFTNLILEPGNADRARLLTEISRGLRIHQFHMGPAPHPVSGAFRALLPWSDWVENGEVVGRVSDLEVSGNALELLGRVVAVGADLQWVGAAALPPLVVDGLTVVRR